MAHKEIRHLKDLSQQVHRGEILIKYLAEQSAQFNNIDSYCCSLKSQLLHYCIPILLNAVVLLIERSNNERCMTHVCRIIRFINLVHLSTAPICLTNTKLPPGDVCFFLPGLSTKKVYHVYFLSVGVVSITVIRHKPPAPAESSNWYLPTILLV